MMSGPLSTLLTHRQAHWLGMRHATHVVCIAVALMHSTQLHFQVLIVIIFSEINAIITQVR